MNCKLLIFFAGLALAAAASVPHLSLAEDLREAFETEDAVYIPISNEEAEFLGLPRSSNGRVRRNVEVLETEDAYYIPISADEAEQLRLPRHVYELEDPTDEDELPMQLVSDEEVLRINPAALSPPTNDANIRAKRQLNVQGGGSAKQGFDISAQGRAKLWESDNKRNTVHGTAQYSQHLGGPYGNSRPNYGAGLSFTHRF